MTLELQPLCQKCRTQPGLLWLEWPYRSSMCERCTRGEIRSNRLAVWVFSVLMACVIAMAAFGIAEDLRRGLRYGLDDLKGIALFVLGLGPFSMAVAWGWLHVRAARRALGRDPSASVEVGSPGRRTRR